jgi:putative NADPH-quinone reductase
MLAVVIVAHPRSDSYTCALARRAAEGLDRVERRLAALTARSV